MRLKSAKTRLLVVDEPTSAMDPTGELHLFEMLRSLRRGKTMVFVTHRFGHLTKHADLILWVQLASAGSAGFIHKRSRASADFFYGRCMQDSELVESGTHKTLMQHNGVYSKLYEVQAKAFADHDSSV